MASKIVISDIEIEVNKKKIKNMLLTVLPPHGNVRISAPYNVRDEMIKLFAIKKIDWIKKQVAKFKNRSRQNEPKFISGESHYLWGHRYKLQIENRKAVNKVEIIANNLVLAACEQSTVKQRQKILNEWYREQLKAEIPAIIEKWEVIIGVKANFVGIKNMRTRWGSCNVVKKRVWINLQLAKMPFRCLEYIVVHELVHLLERSHSAVFVGYMDKFLPNWHLAKDELDNFTTDPG